MAYYGISISILYFSFALKKFNKKENLLVVESRAEKGRSRKTINVTACDQDKKQSFESSLSVHGCSTYCSQGLYCF